MIRTGPWRVAAGSTLGLVVSQGPILFFTFGVFLKPISAEFGWDRATISSAFLVAMIVAALVSPAIGKLIDRYGIRRVTLVFITLFAATTALIARTPASPAGFIFLYAVSGIFSAGQAPLPYAKAISAWFDARRGFALGVAMAGVGIGAALLPQLAQHLIEVFGWRHAYVGLGVATFVLAFPAVALFVRDPERPTGGRASASTGAPGMTLGQALHSSAFWFISLSIFLAVTTVNGTIGHVVPLLTDRGISPQTATSMISIVGLSTIAGRLVAGYLLDRLFAPYVAAGVFLVPVVGLALLGTSADLGALRLAAVCLGTGLGAEVDLLGFLISRYFGLRAFGEIYGYLFAIFTFGTGLGPYLMGLCFDLTRSYNLTLVGFGVLLMVASIVICRLGSYVYPANAIRLERTPVFQRP
jgi:MFS family permease